MKNFQPHTRVNMHTNARPRLSSLFTLLCIFLNLHYAEIVTSQAQAPVTKLIISFCTGAQNACAVFDNKKVKCWGLKKSFGVSLIDNDYLGDVSSELGDNMPFVDIGVNVTINKVACGYQHVCVKLDSNDTRCIGFNNFGQIGLGLSHQVIGFATGYSGSSLPNVNLGNGLKVLDIILGESHSCVLLTGNKVKCYGANSAGQLGYGDTTQRGSTASQMGDSLAFVDLGTNVEVASIHASGSANYNCVIISKPTQNAQRFKCWGHNLFHQLGYWPGQVNGNVGDATGEMGDNLPLVDLGDESKVKQLAIGSFHACALLIIDALKCWGFGSHGQLGSGSSDQIFQSSNNVPFVPIDSFKTIKFVSAGNFQTCVVYDDMITMKCVGNNGYGQLGQGDTTNRGDKPTTVIPFIPAIDLGTGSLKIISIHSERYYNCVLFEDSNIKCFGNNDYGQLGIGSMNSMGGQSYEMGNNLTFVQLFSPTNLPSKNPTINPTPVPTPPSQSPTFNPTKSPTNIPSLNPNTSPTITPTNSPSDASNQPLVIGLSVGIPLFVVLFSCSCCFMRRKRQSTNKQATTEVSSSSNNNSINHSNNADMNGASASIPVANTINEEVEEIEMKNRMNNNAENDSAAEDNYKPSAPYLNINEVPITEAIKMT